MHTAKECDIHFIGLISKAIILLNIRLIRNTTFNQNKQSLHEVYKILRQKWSKVDRIFGFIRTNLVGWNFITKIVQTVWISSVTFSILFYKVQCLQIRTKNTENCRGLCLLRLQCDYLYFTGSICWMFQTHSQFIWTDWILQLNGYNTYNTDLITSSICHSRYNKLGVFPMMVCDGLCSVV